MRPARKSAESLKKVQREDFKRSLTVPEWKSGTDKEAG